MARRLSRKWRRITWLRLRFDDLLLPAHDPGQQSGHANRGRVANRRRYPRGADQFVPDQTIELPGISLQYFSERSPCLHRRLLATDRAHLSLFRPLLSAARTSDDVFLCLVVYDNAILYAV